MKGIPGIVWTLVLVFLATCAQAFINAGGDLFHLDWSAWQLIVNAGVGAVIVFAINYMSPWIDRYGIGAKK